MGVCTCVQGQGFSATDFESNRKDYKLPGPQRRLVPRSLRLAGLPSRLRVRERLGRHLRRESRAPGEDPGKTHGRCARCAER